MSGRKPSPVRPADERREFAAALAHQLRTPLTAILGFSQRLEKGGLTEETARLYAHRIHLEARRLESLSQSILQLTSLDGAPLPPPEPLELDGLIVECILSMQPQWEQKGLEFDAPLPRLRLENRRPLLELVFDNLLSNAVKFSPEGGVIRLWAVQDDDGISVTISNDGPGIAPGDRERIFEPFYRRGEQAGSGLGLPIARRAADLCGGTVTAWAYDEGAAFTVWLPKTAK